MRRKHIRYPLVILSLLLSFLSFSQEKAGKDSIPRLKYNFRYDQSGGLFLKNPTKTEVVFDKALNKFMIVEKIGNYYIKTPIFLTDKEYQKYRLKKDIKSYFQQKISATNLKKKGTKKARKNLLPKYYVNSKFFESIFGGNTVEVIPSGQVNLKLGGTYQRTENPQVQEQNRGNFNFDFDQQISTSLIAKVGKNLKVTANYDTQSTFNFQNVVKLEYTPTEDDIIRNIDAGNVTMPIKNSLINGAQSLFGVKTQLQFGKTKVTAVFSQQNSESKSVVSKNGQTVQSFEIRATDYDNDRHFFLSQFFRENYNATLKNLPLISSPINITRIEVWVTNQNSTVKDFRSIVAFADIGESNPDDLVSSSVTPSATTPTVIIDGQSKKIPTNLANNISTLLTDDGGIRDISTVSSAVAPFNMRQGTDYSYLQNARKLSADQYTLHPQLGFISLNRRLNDGEVLAIAYEYTVVGASDATKNTFRVGEFSNDGINAPKNLALKLLRSEILTTKRPGTNRPFPTWELMMKNIYAIGASPLEKEGFRFELMYRDDKTGVAQNTLQNAQDETLRNRPLINLLNLDKLDQSQYPVQGGDGFFDYIEGTTVNSKNGYIIFPVTEPFGKDLPLNNPADRDKYQFDALYNNIKSLAKNEHQDKDKFLLKGYFKSETGSGGIPIGSFNVPRGSVKVTAGGRQLVEGIDYTVNYQQGVVQILDPGLKTSGIPINVSTENNSFFNQQRKTFMGIDVEHRFSEKFVIGGTLLNVNERPITPKVNFGAEPIDNTMIGFNLDYSSEVPLLTKLVNKLPFVDTDAVSNVSVKVDMAYLIPGSPSDIDINGRATSYIDDFEASQVPIDLMFPSQWFTASTPNTPTFAGFGGNLINSLNYNDKRAKLAWYTIDQLFYGSGGNKPNNIDDNELSRAEVRQVSFSELFRERQLDITQNSLVRTFDLAFYPSERGPYNFDTTDINPAVKISGSATLNNPQQRWGGIMRALNTNNFDQANVEYIQFWIMDPYENYSLTDREGLISGVNPNDITNQVGELYFNLGNISEDILSDGQKQYENGLPADGVKTDLNTNQSNLGRTPKQQSILYSFDDKDDARTNQDVGLDGLKNSEEASYFSSKGVNITNLNPNDIASDNFQYFRGGDLDSENASILMRYKNFSNTEGNSPTINQSKASFPTSSTTYPDVEDINKDQTMNTVESFYEYKVSLNKADLVKGKNNIVDVKTTNVKLPNGTDSKTTWYQFRIPIRSGKPINGISDFNSIRFMRMFLTKFKMPVVLRFGQLQLVRADWRRYVRTLDPNIDRRQLDRDELNKFEVGVVNIEQNENRYVLPPGIARERLQGISSVQERNEQSVTLKVSELPPNKMRAIYKNISIDLRRYKDLKMFLHSEATQVSGVLSDDDMTAIIRLGTDLDDNFYQIEIPLKVSKTNGTPIASEVWPDANDLSVALDRLGKLRLERDKAKLPVDKLYSSADGKIKVKGNPTLATIRTIMLGVRNDASSQRSAEVWFNELRSVGFDNQGGWAAVVNADANFADVANVSLAGKIQTVGFGNVEDRVQQRSLEDFKQYSVATKVNVGKMIPKKWHMQIPMSYNYGEEFKTPEYDLQYQDVKSQDAQSVNPNSENLNHYTRRKGISFTNVKKNRDPKSKKKQKFYDVENFSASYSFNEEYRRDYTIERYINQNLSLGASYNFTFKPYIIEPFKKSEKIKAKYWKFIKELNFNPVPKNLAVNTRINRNYNEQKSRNLIADIGLSSQPTLRQRRFLFNWDYTIGFDLTKSLQLNFNATNNYIYDSFGVKEELEIFDKLFDVGRADNYHQKLNATYKIPIDKIPFLNFISSDYGYTADFDWRASSQSPAILEKVGNTIQNSNTHNLNVNINFDRFYKTIRLDRLLLRKGKKPKNTGHKILKGLYDVITSVKRGQISYSENNGMLLQGYKPTIGFLGRDSYNGGMSPTLGFVFGSQSDIRNVGIQKGWLIARDIGEDYVNKKYSNTYSQKLNYNFSLRPLRDLIIDLRANKIKTSSLSEQLDVIGDRNALGVVENARLNPQTKPFETGNFSTSYFMLPTAFESGDALFEKFLDYRKTIATRLASSSQPIDGFKESGQQVLLPAFLAAYSGKDPNSSSMGIFKNIPMPNWTLRYNGLMKYKWFKKHFASFTLSNGYKSSYTVSNFTSNLQYDANDLTKTNTSGNYQAPLLISSVSLIESFSPLIRVDMKMKNDLSFRAEIKRDRTLTLNFNNSTLTDISGTEYVFGMGYRIKDVKFNTRFTGKKQTIKGDINLRADVSLRDNLTLIRSIDVLNNQTTGGERLFSFKLLADYTLNRNLTASFYYDHQTFNYAISTNFPRQSINTGVRLIYNLGN